MKSLEQNARDISIVHMKKDSKKRDGEMICYTFYRLYLL